MISCWGGRISEHIRGDEALKFNRVVFAVALVFSLVIGALSYSLFFLEWLSLSPQVFTWLFSLVRVGSFIIKLLCLFSQEAGLVI